MRKEKNSKPKELPPKTSVSSAKKGESSSKKGKTAEELWSSSQDDAQSDGPALRLLRKAYAPNIKDGVGELLSEELEKTPPQSEKGKEKLKAKAPSQSERVSRIAEAPKDPHYDIAADFYDRQAHVTFRQLIEDNNFYRMLMTSALKRV